MMLCFLYMQKNVDTHVWSAGRAVGRNQSTHAAAIRVDNLSGLSKTRLWRGPPAMNSTMRPAKLCALFVDDEKHLLDAYTHVFDDEYEVHLANSGAEALQKLRQLKNVAVVISDYHMPGMDGATFLHEVMQYAPQATRILLTGTGGVDSAKDAVNRGQIFRFLSKPCPLPQLRDALAAGVSQYRLLNAERLVLQETLIECIAALMEVLAVTNPVAFGRAQRIKDIVQDVADRLECTGFWQLQAAALLSQLGYFAVNPELAEKMYYGRALNADEQVRAASVPGNARRLLEHVPRLEPVIQILAAVEWTDAELARAGDRMVGLSARILGAALEFDILTNQDLSKAQVLASLRAHKTRFGASVVDALVAKFAEATEESEKVLEIPLRDATPGMRLRQEIRTQLGALLVPIGIEISARLIDRISQVAPALLDQRVKVTVPSAA
jgi:response regulator RpfG family c-di-GMP phosphodiesterase